MEGRGEINVARRHVLSSDDKPDSPNLRDFLRIKQDDNNSKDRNGGEALRSNSNRSLIDMIREDPNGGGTTKDGKRHWRQFREKLRLRRQGSGSSWTSSVPVPASDVPLQPSSSRNRMMMRRDSTRLNNPPSEGSVHADVDLSMGVPRSRSAMIQRNESRAIRRVTGGLEEDVADVDGDRERAGGGTDEEGDGETADEGGAVGGGGGGDQPERMSLMALLAETDKQMGLESSYMMDEDDDDDEEDSSAGYNNCCVCMVRHKGAAFIPCGHTFCRLCSRELWVQRGNCPLCNNFILEILDIF